MSRNVDFYASEVTLCDKWTERDGVPQFSIWQRRPPGRQQPDQILTPTSPWGAERQTVSMQIAIAAVGVKYVFETKCAAQHQHQQAVVYFASQIKFVSHDSC